HGPLFFLFSSICRESCRRRLARRSSRRGSDARWYSIFLPSWVTSGHLDNGCSFPAVRRSDYTKSTACDVGRPAMVRLVSAATAALASSTIDVIGSGCTQWPIADDTEARISVILTEQYDSIDLDLFDARGGKPLV